MNKLGAPVKSDHPSDPVNSDHPSDPVNNDLPRDSLQNDLPSRVLREHAFFMQLYGLGASQLRTRLVSSKDLDSFLTSPSNSW